MDKKIENALKNCLSGAEFTPARQNAVLRAIKGEAKVKKKLSATVIFALVLAFALVCGAVAASLGVFGQFGSKEIGDEEKMQTLDNVSQTYNETQSLQAVTNVTPAAENQTDYEKILAHQQERTFELTLNQAYCAGKKLYISYTLVSPDTAVFSGLGSPSGFESMEVFEAGATYQGRWDNDNPVQCKQATDWFAANKDSWFAYDTYMLGDGACLTDGTVLNILESDESWPDGNTKIGYMVVSLPDNLPNGDTLTFQLHMLYSTFVYYQNESGLAWSTVMTNQITPEDRWANTATFTIRRDGNGTALLGQAKTEAYTASASLVQTDVEITGEVTMEKCPQTWIDTFLMNGDGTEEAGEDKIIGFSLVADGQVMENTDGGFGLNDQDQLVFYVTYNVPTGAQTLSLRPEYNHAGLNDQEDIPLTR